MSVLVSRYRGWEMGGMLQESIWIWTRRGDAAQRVAKRRRKVEVGVMIVSLWVGGDVMDTEEVE